MKKFIYIFLLMLTASLTAGAQTQFWVNGIHYEANSERTLKVIGADQGSYSGVITIPDCAMATVSYVSSYLYGEEYNTVCYVTEIDENAFRDCTGLTGIILPKTIERIGKNAFYGCTGLSSVEIPYGVKSIGASAFAYCTALTSITVPSSVTQMDANVFYGCTGLTSATLSNSVATLSGTFNGCTGLTSITIPSSVTALDGTFAGCTSLNAVTLPKFLKSIGENTFNGCSALSSIYLPNTVRTIGDMAFAYTGLTALEFPDGVASLGENAFYGCVGLRSVTVRATNPPLMANSDGFSNEAYMLATLYVPQVSQSSYLGTNWWRLFRNIEGEESLNNAYSFESGGIYYIETGPNTVSVTYRDTDYNSYSGTVNVPASVTLDGVTYSVTGVGNSAFRGCTALTAVTLPATVTSIGSLAFNQAGFTDIDIPEAVTSIGDSAFYLCSGLTSLTIPVNVTSIGKNALAGFSLQSLTWNARECWSNGGMTTRSLTSVDIGNEVTVLPNNFAYNSRLASVVLPTSLKTIGERAFMNANIKDWTIPENVETIGTGALDNNYPNTLVWNARRCWDLGQNYSWESPFYTIQELTIGDGVEVLPYYFVCGASISSLSIPESVKHICTAAFQNCSNLTDVVVPDSVESIGNYAFYCQDKDLSSITIGKSVTDIGSNAINHVKTVIWNARNCRTMGIYYNDYYVDENFSWEKVKFGNEVERIPNYFAYRTSIKTVEIPPSVKEIGDGAFFNCAALKDLSIPGSVTTIGNSSFSNCIGLTSVYVPTTVKRMGAAFSGCSGLTDATVGASFIGRNAFSGCGKLNNLTLLNLVDTIEAFAFSDCRQLTSLYIPCTVTSIKSESFKNCSNLMSIVVDGANPVYDSRGNCNAVVSTADASLILTCKNTVLPDDIVEIGDYAFYDRSDLHNFVIPSTVKRIGKYAFYFCSGLTELNLPDGLETIDTAAFYYCSRLTSMQVPNSVTTLGASAFRGCSKMTSVTIPNHLKSIGTNTFAGCNKLGAIDLPDTLESIGSYAFSCCGSLTELDIPATVNSIGYAAFEYCSGLTSIVIPEGVTNIPSSMLSNCTGLTSVTIGDNVTSIGDYAFSRCTSLTSFEIPNSVTYISYNAFSGCSGLTSIVIPNSVTSIESYTFSSCSNLTDVVIGSSVNVIGYSAFSGCSALNSITCLAITPPTLYANIVSAATYENATLYVPQESVEAYKAASYWKNFLNIEPIQERVLGDVDGDGELNIKDVTLLISALLGDGGNKAANCDVNSDGKVNIRDVTALISLVLSEDR